MRIPPLYILVSPNERDEMKSALGEIGLYAPMPFDFLIYTRRGILGAERKVFPSDFLASVDDGRLMKECAALRERARFRVIILEGLPRYTSSNHLISGTRPSRWTRDGIENMLRSIRYVMGCDPEWSDGIPDTVRLLRDLAGYFNGEHRSLLTRPGFESNWPIPVYREQVDYFYQGLPGIGVKRSHLLSEVFPSPQGLFAAGREQFIDAIGPKSGGRVFEFLHPNHKD